MKPNVPSLANVLCLLPHFNSRPYPCKSKKLQELRVKEREKHVMKKSFLKVTNREPRHLPWAKNSLATHPSLLAHAKPSPHHLVPCSKEWKPEKKKHSVVSMLLKLQYNAAVNWPVPVHIELIYHISEKRPPTSDCHFPHVQRERSGSQL